VPIIPGGEAVEISGTGHLILDNNAHLGMVGSLLLFELDVPVIENGEFKGKTQEQKLLFTSHYSIRQMGVLVDALIESSLRQARHYDQLKENGQMTVAEHREAYQPLIENIRTLRRYKKAVEQTDRQHHAEPMGNLEVSRHLNRLWSDINDAELELLGD